MNRIPCLCLLLLACTLRPVLAPAQARVSLFDEHFETAVVPAPPEGWAVTGAGWGTATTSASTGSGGVNLEHRGTQPGRITTVVLDLRGMTTGSLEYLARRSSSYPQERLRVTASVDGGATFPVEVIPAGSALPAGESVWVSQSAALPEALLGQAAVVFRFEAEGGTSATSVMRIDDVLLAGTVPMLSISPARLDFGPVVLGGRAEATLSLTNTGNLDLAVEHVRVTGEGFSIQSEEGFLLGPGEGRDVVIAFMPVGTAAAAGSVLITHGGPGSPAIVALSGIGTSALNTLGFSAGESTVLENTALVEIPVRLVFRREAGGLQGVQFDLGSSSDRLRLVGAAPGPAVASAADWQLAHEVTGQTMRVILLGNGTNALPPGEHDPVVIVHAAAGSAGEADEEVVSLTMSGIIGALATPEGADAGLVPDTEVHSLRIQRSRAFFEAAPPGLDFGRVAVGAQGELLLEVSNPGGSKALVITSVAATNPLFGISPATAEIPPGGKASFVVSFAPTPAEFGRQEGSVVFTHNGEGGGSTLLPLVGLGFHGQGDADGDGRVDAVDLVLGIDFVLGRRTPAEQAAQTVDRHPYPSGDGTLDVRDMTVLAQAIARGAWPDGVLLPASEAEPAVAAKGMEAGAHPVQLSLRNTDAGTRVQVDARIPIRALQVDLEIRTGGSLAAVEPGTVLQTDAVVMTHFRPERGRLRVLAYRPDGLMLPETPFELMSIRGVPMDDLRVIDALAVDGEVRRTAVGVSTERGTGTEEGEDVPAVFQIGEPYPNPFRAGSGLLRIPVTVPDLRHLQAALFDAQGKRVARLADRPYAAGRWLLAWDGRDEQGNPVSAGIYFLRAGDGRGGAVHTIVVIR